jgi:hypothetical protein
VDLPDLRARVRVDTSGVTEAEAKLAAFSESVKHSLDSGPVERLAQQAGQAFIKFGDSGEIASLRLRSSTARSKGDLDELEQRARSFASGLEGDFAKGTTAIVKLGEDGSAALANVSQQGAQTSSVFARLGPLVASLGTVGMPILIGAVVVLGLVLAPVIVELSAFTVGLAAVVAVMTIGLGLFTGLAGGAVALAAATGNLGDTSGKAAATQQELALATDKVNVAQQRVINAQATLTAAVNRHGAASLQAANAQAQLTTATDALTTAQGNLNTLQQQGVGPLAALRANASAAANALGQQVAPAARQVLTFVNELIAPTASLAQQTVAWFNSNSRVGNALGIVSGFANSLFEVLDKKLGPALGRFLDAWLARGPQWQALFQSALNVGVGAAVGLLTNLLRLSDWFAKELPVIGPGVQAVFDGMGTAIQGVGQVLGAVLIPLFKLMAQHTDLVQATVIGLVVVLGTAVVVVAGVALIVFAAAAAVQWFGQRVGDLIGWVSRIPGVSLAASVAFQILAGFAYGAAGRILAIVGAVQTVIGAIGQLGSAVSHLPSIPGLGSGRQHGGPVIAGSVYRVGEAGPETLVMNRSGGGYVVPDGGSSAGASVDLRMTNGLLRQQNALLAALLAEASAPASTGNWPFQGR